MRVANLDGRLAVLTGSGAVDVERASGRRFSADPQAVYERWDEFVDWVAAADLAAQGHQYDQHRLGPPAPAPRQILAVGFNYREHATELAAGVSADLPLVFTKFASSVTGPYATITLPDGRVDWEVELVAVMGRRAWQVPAADAWHHVAGLTVGQDISERDTQLRGSTPQFSLGKSFPGFAPMGPWLVTPDELADPDDLRVACTLNGELVQQARTSQLITPVPALIAQLSAILVLLPGDVLYTGTPAGVGIGREPAIFLSAGDELVSSIEGIGEMRHTLRSRTPGISTHGLPNSFDQENLR